MLEKRSIRPGWRAVRGMSGSRGDAAIKAKWRRFSCPHTIHWPPPSSPRHTAPAQSSIAVDVDSLDDLRPAFDEVRPLKGGTDKAIDDALANAVIGLQQAGRTVAILSSSAAQAISSADLALGMVPRQGAGPPPWGADLLVPDLAAAWRVFHALPAARTAAQRGNRDCCRRNGHGVAVHDPGSPGRLGSETVNVGAAAGLLSGYLLARGILNAETPRPAALHEWHAMSVEQVRKALARRMLPDAAERRFVRRVEQPSESPLEAIWQLVKAVRAELSDPLTPVMALGSAASAILGSPVDAVLVGTVLTGNSILAAAQRLRAEKRLNYLLDSASSASAHGSRLVQTVTALTSRSMPRNCGPATSSRCAPTRWCPPTRASSKRSMSRSTSQRSPVSRCRWTSRSAATPGAPLAERRCMLFAGTTVVAGTAVALVTATGADTQQRRAADLISGELSSDIGLQHQLGRLTNQALPVSMGGGAVVGALGLLRRTPLRDAVSSGIAIAVAAVPEGMPLVATLAQAASARRLTKFGALVRVPRSVEALGRIEVVCFDKTGTLSENRLRVSQVHPAGDSDAAQAEVLRCAAHAAPVTEGGLQAHATDVAIVEGWPTRRVFSAARWRQFEPHRSLAVPLRQVVLRLGDRNRADRQRRTRSGAGRMR